MYKKTLFFVKEFIATEANKFLTKAFTVTGIFLLIAHTNFMPMAHADTVVTAQVSSDLPRSYVELQKYLQNKIGIIQQAIQQSADDAMTTEDCLPQPCPPLQAWFFRSFFLKLRPQVSIDIPAFADLKIMPEVELVFERTLAEGWKSYKPRN